MNQLFRTLGLLTLSSLLILTGCTKNLKYQASPLSPLTTPRARTTKTKNNVTISAKRLNRKEKLHYFNSEDIGAEVVQLSIKNDGNNPWVLSQDCIDLPLVDSKVVSQKLQASIGKSVAMVLIPFVGLPLSIIHGISSHDANERIKEDIEEKAMPLDLVVGAHQQKDVLIFVKKDAFGIDKGRSYGKEWRKFDVILSDANNKTNTMPIELTV